MEAPPTEKSTPLEDSAEPTRHDATLPVQPGELFQNKYRIERLLGRGGMGVVMAARHERLDERVAIKFLAKAASGRKDALARFEREARAAAKIKNEHVAQVIDVGVFGEDGAYMVAEYLEGLDLGALLDQHGKAAVPDAVDWVLQAIDAIADAHAIGIVHRDLKPSNLFLTRRSNGLPLIKVLDFGIAKSESLSSSEGADSLTATHAIMGSPRYMSPEQIRSTKSVDHRSDIWSLGVILYELVTSTTPFQGDTSTELFAAVLMDAPRPPRELCPDLPEALEAVILRCLKRDREERYVNVAALARDLGPFAPARSRALLDRFSVEAPGVATDQTMLAGPMGTPPAAPAQTDTAWTPREALEPAKARSGTFTVVALGLLLLLGLGIASWKLWLAPRPEAERPKLEAISPPIHAAEPIPSISAAPAAPSVTPIASVAPEASASASPVASTKKPSAPPRPAAAPPKAVPKKSSILEARE